MPGEHACRASEAGLVPAATPDLLIATSATRGVAGAVDVASALLSALSGVRKERFEVLPEMQTGSPLATCSLRERYHFRIVGRDLEAQR